MGKMKESPRYNVLSFRCDDYELREILERVDGSRQEYILQAVMEKVVRDRQMSMDEYLRSMGVTDL